MDKLWEPSADRIKGTRMAAFMAACGFEDYDDLWTWSLEHPETFWNRLWDFVGIKGTQGDCVIRDGDDVFNARFFPDGQINYAENMLVRRGADAAIIYHSEDGQRTEWSWDHLHATVSQLQQALADCGVDVGDRVAGFVPNTPEALAMMLATASLGAVWSSCSPDFGTSGVLDRFGQIEPKVFVCADGYRYNGKEHSSLTTAGAVVAKLPSVTQVFVFDHIATKADLSAIGPKAVHLSDVLANMPVKDVAYTRVPFNSPLFIMFSSGTTGLPKCIVHGVGGSVLQHAKEHHLHCDLTAEDRLFYFTTCGWMMWNWQMSGLCTGATLVVYDGSPFYPDGNRLADIVETESVTHFGTSAKYLDACAKAGVKPAVTHDLGALRTILSTGSPLAPEGFDYVYADWKADVCLSSIAGGTDILACFVGGSPIAPVYRGQCQKRLLGMNVHAFDPEGRPVKGEPGELVCTAPHPSQPIGFWNDPEGAKYHAAYFARFDNVWHHGDWVTLTEEGGTVFHGRSDAVLNPGGVRIGTAEIYRQVERVEEVLEGLVIGQQWQGDVRVVLFVRLRDGVDLDDALIARIKSEIRANTTPRHVPAKVIAVADIPRTKSGKITELAVRDVVHGRAVKNTEAMANPEALAHFRDIPELQR